MIKSKITKLVAALVVGLGVCAGAMAQADGQNNSYYEGKAWDQFHGEQHYFKGSPSAICAAAIRAWNKTTEVAWIEPKYTQIIEGIYKGNYEIRPSPPYTFPYIYCSADLKTSYIYPTHPALNRVYLNENFNAVVTITKVVDCDKINMMRSASAENIEACKKPEPDFCEEARKVGESPLPEGCYDPCRNMQSKNSEIGGVVCLNDTDRHICVWKRGLDTLKLRTNISRDVIKLCARPHEQSHIDTEKEFGVCRDGRLGPMGEKDTPERERNSHESEYRAFEASIKCLNDNMVRCTEYPVDSLEANGSRDRGRCLGDIRDEITRMETERDTHKNAL